MADIGSLYESDRHENTCRDCLTGSVTADVAVIGGGLSGISTALHLARQGVSVALLEAETPGWGASGRNGGQINPGLKFSPQEIIAHFGPTVGTRLVDEAWRAPDLVFDLIRHYAISCDAARGGTIRAATAPQQLPPLRALMAECAALEAPVHWLDAKAMAERTGSDFYCGGLLDDRGGQLDPLAYTNGLARAATQEGARLYANSRVVSLKRQNGRWQAATLRGAVTAEKVIVATNGYTGPLWNDLRRSVVPVYSSIIASAPLPRPLRDRILARRESLYELGQITTYYRVDGQGRLLMGGRSFSHPAQGPEKFAYLAKRAAMLWPALGDLAWTHGWNGQLAVTLDHYPHWHEPAPGLLAVLGYNGRGVAMATLMGRAIADYLSGREPPLFPPTPVKPIWGHAFWPLGVTGRIAWGRVMDCVDHGFSRKA
ncbi:MAG: FAD-binding oxidoreductase [Acetobacter sp.]|uniref:NAD(P)/FAD-dependent oxidoreductase n=1 Tax=Acetobacter sp. TaxID=440 RepID=UPI0039EA2832